MSGVGGRYEVASSGCWEFTGYRDRDGYGVISAGRRGRTTGAHRAVWFEVNGQIPAGFEVCHHCDNPSCVNPDHLFLGTHADNMRDARDKGHLSWVCGPGEANGHARLTESDVKRIRERLAEGLTRQAVALEFGVSRSTVSHIANGRKWRHVP